jgi:trans-2,3-dihydro-3-hydroxyanthranilate isomerase
VVLTKAGPITIFSNPYRQVQACVVPHNVHTHSNTISIDDVLATQPQIQIIPAMDQLKGKTFPVVSIVKGMTFSLVDLTDAPEVMAALRASESPAAKLDEEWNVGLTGCLYYQRDAIEEREGEPAIHKIHQRMMVSGLEDAGTGSASCALSCYLALGMTDESVGRSIRPSEQRDTSQVDADIAAETKALHLGAKKGYYVFGIEQGVEMGRKCQICVEVEITEDEEGHRAVTSVVLSGRSTVMTKGEIVGIY